MKFGFDSLLNIFSQSGQGRDISNRLLGRGVALSWENGGHAEKAEIYAADIPRLHAALDEAARSGKMQWDLVEAAAATQTGNVTCIARFNEKGFSDGPGGEPAIRHFYPGSGQMFLAEHWRDGSYVSELRDGQPRPQPRP